MEVFGGGEGGALALKGMASTVAMSFAGSEQEDDLKQR